MVDMNLLEILSLVAISMTITLGSIDSLREQSGTDTGSCRASSSWLDVILIIINVVLVIFMLGKLVLGKRCQCGKDPEDMPDIVPPPVHLRKSIFSRISGLFSRKSNGDGEEIELHEVGGLNDLPEAPPKPAKCGPSASSVESFVHDMDTIVDAVRAEQQTDDVHSRIEKHAESVHSLDLR